VNTNQLYKESNLGNSFTKLTMMRNRYPGSSLQLKPIPQLETEMDLNKSEGG